MGSNSFVNRIRRWSTPAGDDHQFSSTPQTMTKTSTWMALRNPVFRKLWIASAISGTCVAAHDTAVTWLMNMLTPSPFLISVLATVASLPFFFVHAARRRPSRYGGPQEFSLPDQPLVGCRGCRSSNSWLAPSSQSLCDHD